MEISQSSRMKLILDLSSLMPWTVAFTTEVLILQGSESLKHKFQQTFMNVASTYGINDEGTFLDSLKAEDSIGG